MKKMVFSLFILTLFAFSSPSTKALGDDLTPPSWLRGSAQTTFQAWDFTVLSWFDDVGAAPTSSLIGSGNYVGGALYLGYSFTDAGLQFSFYVPNFIDSDTQKSLHIQITGAGSIVESIIADNSSGQLVLDSSGGNFLPYHYEDWVIFPNPASEIINILTIPDGNLPMQVVIDTISFTPSVAVPEPTTMICLAASLGMGYLTRKTKRKATSIA